MTTALKEKTESFIKVSTTAIGRQTAGHSQSRERASSRAVFQSASAAPPLPPPPSSVLVIEPPPPYTAAASGSSVPLGGPKHGHRRNRRRNDVEMRVKNRRN